MSRKSRSASYPVVHALAINILNPSSSILLLRSFAVSFSFMFIERQTHWASERRNGRTDEGTKCPNRMIRQLLLLSLLHQQFQIGPPWLSPLLSSSLLSFLFFFHSFAAHPRALSTGLLQLNDTCHITAILLLPASQHMPSY